MNRPLSWFPVTLVVILLTVGALALAQPTLKLDVTLPETIGDDDQFVVAVTLTNKLAVPVEFDGTIFVFGDGWGKENYPYSFSENTEVYWTECNTEISRDGCKLWWKGTIPKKSSVEFTMATFSGNIPGTFPFIEVLIGTSKGPFQEEKNLAVTP